MTHASKRCGQRHKCRRPHTGFPSPPRFQSRPNLGVTILEVVISVFLVSTVLLISLTASANLIRFQSSEQSANTGYDLAYQYLDEITAMAFADVGNTATFGLEPDETASQRSTYDDVDDYNGFAESSPTFRDGTANTAFSDWSVSVSVQRVSFGGSGLVTSTDDAAPMKLITVTCTAPSGQQTVQAAIVSHLPCDAAAGTSYERLRRLRLSFPDRTLDVTVPMRNAPDWSTY